MKGAGESGLGGAMAVILNAVGDALSGAKDSIDQVPVSPERLLTFLVEQQA
jgi:carbon-monoxide dehydrogenase large subunit